MSRFFIMFSLALCVFNAAAQAGDKIAGPVAAQVVKVRDGDSIDVIARVWPGHDVRVSIRLRGIDAPELKARCAEEKSKALAARKRLRDLLASGAVRLMQISGGKYFGRVLARVETEAGLDVQEILLAEKLVRPYRGRKRQSWCKQSAELR